MKSERTIRETYNSLSKEQKEAVSLIFGYVMKDVIDVVNLDSKYLKRMKEECSNDDTEIDHANADKILVDLLRDIGLVDVATFYENLPK